MPQRPDAPAASVWEQVAKPVIAALALSLSFHFGGLSWWIAGGVAAAYLNILWTIHARA